MVTSSTLPTVQYDRPARQWVVRNGHEIARFPSGPENRIKAEWLAIAHASAPVYEAAQSLASELAHVQGAGGRVLRAAWIVVKGDVLSATPPATVRSQTIPGKSYQVEERSLIGLACTCDDWNNGREARFFDRPGAAPTVAGQTYCKHILAILILARAAELEQASASQAAARKLEERQIAAATRQERERQERAATCPTCKGRGVYTGVDSWTGCIGPMRCHCQTDW